MRLFFRVQDLTPFRNVIDGRTRRGDRVRLNGVSLRNGNNAILGKG